MIKKCLLLAVTVAIGATFVSGQKNPSLVAAKRQRSHDQAVKITFKPQPAYPDQSGGSICVQGTVILRIEFMNTGEIGRIVPVKGLPNGLTENTIESARKIRFIPATKAGKPVTVFRQVEYTFSIY
jgi:hypothetical protein